MKPLLAAVVFLAAMAAFGQTTPAQDGTESQFLQGMAARPLRFSLHASNPTKPNEVKIHGRTYSGILVELEKTDKPLELINPWAPADYGLPQDNVARDPISGRVLGWKLFSVQF